MGDISSEEYLSEEEAQPVPVMASLKEKTKQTKPLYDMVLDAVKETHEHRKGASIIAVKNYILQKFGIETSNPRLKKAIEKGIENGTLARPKGSEDQKASLTGRLLLARSSSKSAITSGKPKAGESGTADKPKKGSIKKSPKKTTAGTTKAAGAAGKTKAVPKKAANGRPKAKAEKAASSAPSPTEEGESEEEDMETESDPEPAPPAPVAKRPTSKKGAGAAKKAASPRKGPAKNASPRKAAAKKAASPAAKKKAAKPKSPVPAPRRKAAARK